MINLTHDEALLFRLLTGFFGREHVIPHMSVMAVCGGSLPENVVIDQGVVPPPVYRVKSARFRGRTPDSVIGWPDDLDEWARDNRCLFTIVDGEDVPKMVVEFLSGFESSVVQSEAEHQLVLKPLLAAREIRYVTISGEEFKELMNPSSHLDFCAFLRSKCEGLTEGPEAE